MSVSEPLTVGRYTIYDKIASGGMASVHFGRFGGAAGFSRTVAVKRLHPHLTEERDFVAMLLDEARLSARVRHPNVVQMLDVVEVGADICLIMEYVHGDSLSRLLRGERERRRRAALPIVSAVMSGVLLGLQAAHDATSDRGEPLDIVHRDVSPQNVLVGTDGVARVIDFGVAKAANRMHTTRDGKLKGKFAYMAPEQLSGKVSHLTDVYAAGLVLWEALVGRRAFEGDEAGEVFARIMAGNVRHPRELVPEIPEALDDLVMRAIALDPAQRFASARGMAEALVRVVPPAQPTEVGAWVIEVAHESLAKKDAHIAEIESHSGVVAAPAQPPVEDATTVVSDPTSFVPVEASKGGVGASRFPRRFWVMSGALGGCVLLGLGIGVFVSHSGRQTIVEAPSSPPIQAHASSPLVREEPSSVEAKPAITGVGEIAAVSDSASSAPPPPRVRPRASAVKPAATSPLKFTHPD